MFFDIYIAVVLYFSAGETVEVHLTMGAQTYPDTISRNTIVEVRGEEWPEETVLVSGHIDSWDVGQGVMDDAGECVRGNV